MWYPSSGSFWGWNMKNQTGKLIKSGLGYAMALAGFITRSCTSPGGPVSVAIEPGNMCNLRCPLCAAGAGELNRPKGSMKLADFKKVMLPEITGIEQMIGLFVNTIPIRIRGEGSESFVNLLSRVQQHMHSSGKYDYTPLVEIQAASQLKQVLFLQMSRICRDTCNRSH